MRDRTCKRFLDEWRGPFLYVLIAFCAGLVNSWALQRAVSTDQDGVAGDLKTVIVVFTGISFLSLGLQFLYARAIGPGRKTDWLVGISLSAAVAISAFAVSFIAISSTLRFQGETAALVAIAVFFAVQSSAQLATLLINREWITISALVMAGVILRTALWETEWLSGDLHGFLLGIIFSNLGIFILVTLMVHRTRYERVRHLRMLSQWVPMGTLVGLIVILIAGSVSRRSALGLESTEYVDAGLIGRKVFYLVAVIAYAAFPALCNSPLFSREFGRNYRQAQIFAAVLAIVSGVVFLQIEVSDGSTAVSQNVLTIQVISWVIFSISLIPLLYFMAHNSRVGMAVVIPALVMVSAQLFASSSLSLAIAFLVSNSILLMLVMIPALVRNRPIVHAVRKKGSRDHPLNQASLTVVIPSFNPGARVVKTIHDVHAEFQKIGQEVLIVAVSDGSSDVSVALLNEIRDDWFTHILLPENVGKGGALLAGFENLSTSYVGFIDADGDIPPSLLPGMFDAAMEEGADVVFGSKWHPDSDVAVSSARRALSRLHHLLQMTLFKLDIKDTQVGIKVYKTASLQMVTHTLKENGFSLDLEIFVSMSAHGLNKFVEMPVTILRTGESTISPGSIVQAFLDMIRIFWRSRIVLEYDSFAYLSNYEKSEELR